MYVKHDYLAAFVYCQDVNLSTCRHRCAPGPLFCPQHMSAALRVNPTISRVFTPLLCFIIAKQKHRIDMSVLTYYHALSFTYFLM